jgi:transcriptional regulator GlxA family with amidase domain
MRRHFFLLSRLGSASSQRVYVSRITLCRLISVSPSRFTLLHSLLFAPRAVILVVHGAKYLLLPIHRGNKKKKERESIGLSRSPPRSMSRLSISVSPHVAAQRDGPAAAGPTPRVGASASAAPAPPCALQFSLTRRRRRAKLVATATGSPLLPPRGLLHGVHTALQ